MKKLLCLIGGAMLAWNAQAQQISITPYDIGDWVPDLPLTHLLNYTDSVAKMSSFRDKLIILDFWAIFCSDCIAMFPKEEALQKANNDRIQFILVTNNSTKKVKEFFHSWDSTHHMHLSMPIVTSDEFIHKLFKNKYIPHYVWITPNGQILAQTTQKFINQKTITEILKQIDSKTLPTGASKMYGFPKPLVDFTKIIHIIR